MKPFEHLESLLMSWWHESSVFSERHKVYTLLWRIQKQVWKTTGTEMYNIDGIFLHIHYSADHEQQIWANSDMTLSKAVLSLKVWTQTQVSQEVAVECLHRLLNNIYLFVIMENIIRMTCHTFIFDKWNTILQALLKAAAQATLFNENILREKMSFIF